MIFLTIAAIYSFIGLCTTPFFTRCIFYDEINPERYTARDSWAKSQAKRSAGIAYAQSLAWPVFLFIHFNSVHALRGLDKYHEKREKAAQDELKIKEANKIVEQYKRDNSWEAKFKKLEAETLNKVNQ